MQTCLLKINYPPRYSARFIPPDIWRLEVREVRPTDAAHYDCQLSAHPPRTARVTLLVPGTFDNNNDLYNSYKKNLNYVYHIYISTYLCKAYVGKLGL